MATPLSPRAPRTPACASHMPEQQTTYLENQCVPQASWTASRLPERLRESAGTDFHSRRCHLSTAKITAMAQDATFAAPPEPPASPKTVPPAEKLRGSGSNAEPRPTLPSGILSSSTAIVYHLFRNIGDPFELARAAAVSRLWRDVASVPSLWAALLDQEHRAASAPPPSAPSAAGPEPDDRTHVARDVAQQQQQQQQRDRDAEGLQQQRRPAQLLPRDLLQPPCDVLDSPASQLGRWLGIRRLVPEAGRLSGVRGAWAAYVPVTNRLVVLDQEEQQVAFVDLESGAAGPSDGGGHGGRAGGVAAGGCASGGGAAAGNDKQENEDAGFARQRLVPLVAAKAPRTDASAAAVVAAPAVVHVRVPELAPEPQSEAQGGGDGDGGGAAVVAVLDGAAAAAAPEGPLPDVPQAGQQEQEQQQAEEGSEEVRPEDRHKLQVVAACGGGMVATGHLDGRVLVWDSARASLAYTLPPVEGCGRGPVLALAADERLLAVAYRREVLVWELPAGLQGGESGGRGRGGGKGGGDGGADGGERARSASSSAAVLSSSAPCVEGRCEGGGGGGAACRAGAESRPILAALIKPTLGTAIRSMALSARHGVLAMRSWDGVELREARGGRWLHSLPDRRNTALLAAGDVLFIASSSPSFLGNSFLEFQIEVAAVDLAAVVAAAAAAADGGDGGGGGGGGDQGGAAAAGAAPDQAAVGSSTANGARQNGPAQAPLVVRAVSPPQRHKLRGPPLLEFKWDQPMQLCLTGGMLLLRCLQFPLAPGQLAWPGMFAFRMGDLVSGLALGQRKDGGGGGGGADGGDGGGGADGGVSPAPPPPPGLAAPAQGRAAAPAPALDRQPAERELPPAAAPGLAAGDGAAAAAAAAIGDGGAAARDAAAAAAAAPPPVVLCRTVQPEVLCGDGGFATEWSGGAGTAGGTAGGGTAAGMGVLRRSSAASVQLLAARRHLVILSESYEAWAMSVPYCAPRRA
ncbi:hypothetical protein PLESTF_000095900 [Pleodorina starrii]|nr:hypothetical protein PLESTF_000095900 [Pleodorina starrii]